MKRKKAMLIAAGQNGDVAAIRELVAAGAPVDAQEEFEVCPDDAEGVQNGGGMTALHYAAAYGHEDAVDALVGAGANLETADVYGSTALASDAPRRPHPPFPAGVCRVASHSPIHITATLIV